MDNTEKISYWVYESAQARADRRFQKMWILVLVLIVLLVGSNVGWLYYEQQFEDTVITQDLDAGDGGTATINDGVHINGESNANN
jgi:uncharacterized membrane protein YpjA